MACCSAAERKGTIRKALIEENLLDAVIGLPANLFTTTGIPVAILIFDRSREQGGANEKRKDVLFIDASKEFTPGKTQNLLDEGTSRKIVETYRARKEDRQALAPRHAGGDRGERLQPEHPALRRYLRAGGRNRRRRAGP